MMSPMSNHVTLSIGSSSSGSGRASYPTQNDRERSRNAKAQARHRAKRKAYVEQLEQTVTRLQSALALNSDDMPTSIPSPLHRVRELEEENSRLHQENAELRRQIEYRTTQTLRPDIGRRTSAADMNCQYDERTTSSWDLEAKKPRYNNQDDDRDFVLRPAGARNSMQPPPPLHIPQQQHYSMSSPHTGSAHPMYHHNGTMAYPVASPLSTSSSASSPSFSPHHLSPINSRPSMGHNQALPSLNEQYPVKTEDDCYLPTPTLTHSNHYSYPNEPVSVGTNPWHAYPSERSQ